MDTMEYDKERNECKMGLLRLCCLWSRVYQKEKKSPSTSSFPLSFLRDPKKRLTYLPTYLQGTNALFHNCQGHPLPALSAPSPLDVISSRCCPVLLYVNLSKVHSHLQTPSIDTLGGNDSWGTLDKGLCDVQVPGCLPSPSLGRLSLLLPLVPVGAFLFLLYCVYSHALPMQQ